MKRTRPATVAQPARAARSSTPVWALAAGVVILAVGVAAWFVQRTPPAPPAVPATPPTIATFVGSGECKACHAKEFAAWTSSQHARAMQHATAETVRGDFS
ncbi:MAG: multiheme c-type cytochrome, partial [Betaproteobacteria bacterium]